MAHPCVFSDAVKVFIVASNKKKNFLKIAITSIDSTEGQLLLPWDNIYVSKIIGPNNISRHLKPSLEDYAQLVRYQFVF